MKCNCGPLIKAIDAYIAGADDDLTGELGEAGYIDPEGTVEHASKLEELTAAALVAETEYIGTSEKNGT